MTAKSKRPMGKERFLNIMAERQFAYSFLHRLFMEEPSKEFVELIIKEDLVGVFPGREDERIKKDLETLNFYLKDPDLLSDDNINDLKADYVNLFIGPGKLPSPPYESVYRSKKKLVFQDETIEVRQTYAREKLVFANMHREPDDHIGLELDFITQLTKRAAKEFRAAQLGKVKKTLKVVSDFMDNHILEWVPRFAEDVTSSARTDFYRAAGKILNGYVSLDKKQLSELISAVAERIKLKSV